MKCRKCGAEVDSEFCPECGQRSKSKDKHRKPIFLRWWFIFLVIIVIAAVALNAGRDNNNGGTKAEQFEWNDIEMHEVLPKPYNTYGIISYNSKASLILTLCDADDKMFNNYRDECINMGYTIDSEESYMSYSAYNEDGYSVRLVFSDSNKEINVYLDAPKEMDEFEWPTNGLGAKLPIPKSTLGDISWDNSETFIVEVGSMTIDDYKDYVKLCEDIGFTVEHSRDDEYYSAKNENGYKLTLRYLGFNRIEVSIKAPEESTTAPTTEHSNPQATEKEPEKESTAKGGLGSDFKAAMDDYEDFIDEYVRFMKKYNDNPSNLGLLADYAKYMSKYAELVMDFEKWGDTEMTTEETAYYIEVQTRVSKKLLELDS